MKGNVMAEVTSGDVTVIVLARAEADTLADMLGCLVDILGDGEGVPSDWEAFADDLGVL